MPIEVKCYGCEKVLRIASEPLGKTPESFYLCEKCHKRIWGR